jgi:hypothetical protein
MLLVYSLRWKVGELTLFIQSARGRKIPLLKMAFEKYPKFEAVEIADVAIAGFSAAFKGMTLTHCGDGAVQIHCLAGLTAKLHSRYLYPALPTFYISDRHHKARSKNLFTFCGKPTRISGNWSLRVRY